MDGLRLNKLTANFWVNYPAFNHTHDSNLGTRSPATVANKISFNTLKRADSVLYADFKPD